MGVVNEAVEDRIGISRVADKGVPADPNRASRGAVYPSDIIPEWRAKSSRNAERDQIGMVGDIIADLRATSPGIRRSEADGSGGAFFLKFCNAQEPLSQKIASGKLA
jgi:hypothetical protein